VTTNAKLRPPLPVRDLVLGGLFLALALVLPMTFHLLGAGRAFTPMHIPVFLAAFTVAPWASVLVGLAAPLLSAVLTGMPPLSPPIAQGMVLEFVTYAFVTALIYRATRRIYLSWAIGALAGRIALGLFGAAVLPLFGFTATPLLYPLAAGLAAQLPGLGVQAVLIPPIVWAVQRAAARKQSAIAGNPRSGGRP
jgi:hypothetical protein